MMKNNLPPIFKVSNNNFKTNNQIISNIKLAKGDRRKEVDTDLSIRKKLDKIFNTSGYAFNIPVRIKLSGKVIDTYLALRKNDSIITLDNEVIPIALIESLEIKSPSV